jgi:CRP/FNR family cyclic AMP-dependent transcriptional regulator
MAADDAPLVDLSGFGEDDFEYFGPGEVIFTQGESAECMYLVVEGRVELRVSGATVGEVGKEGVLGEMALLDKAPRSAMAIAVGDARLLPIDTYLFETLVRKEPRFLRLVLRVMAERLRRMNAAALPPDPRPLPQGSTAALDLAALRPLQTSFAAGECIFRTGDPGKHLFIVQTGSVELRIGDRVIHIIEPGGFFGEMALVADAPRSASAWARRDCKLLPIDHARFDALLQRTPDFGLEMMRVMAERLRRMNRETVERDPDAVPGDDAGAGPTPA